MKEKTFPEKFLFYFSVFLIVFAIFLSLIIHDFLWIIDRLFLLLFIGGIEIFAYIFIENETFYPKNVYVSIYIEFVVLLSVFSGKNGILAKIGYSTLGEYINLVSLLLLIFLIIGSVFVHLKKQRKLI